MTRLGDVSRGLGVAVDVVPFLIQADVIATIPDDVLIDVYVLLLPIIVGVLLTSYEEYILPAHASSVLTLFTLATLVPVYEY